jgi:hypothetical protein
VGLKAAGWALGGVLLCVLVAAAVLVVRAPGPQEAAGQEATTPERPPATAPPATAPPASVPPLFPELTDEFFSPPAEPEDTLEGIPGLSVMDVLGNLYRFPVDGRFVCRGPVPGDEAGTNLWVCSTPSARTPATHEVTVVGDDPRTVLSVEATVRGTSEEEAAEFFAYVAGLCLQDADPLNPEAWVNANVASGGQVFTEGAEFSVYGTEEERTLQVMAAGVF